MRAGLITFHFAHHYGAQLQALATMKAIQALGHDCQIIDYRLPHTTRTNQLFKKSASVRAVAADAHTALHYGSFQRRFRRFEAFVAEEMALSPRRYTSVDQLRAEAPEYDVYVAGSDQIWNPYIFADRQFDPAFLLDFGGAVRRIAYAPSLGVPTLPEDKAAELKGFLAPFSALSVREKRGQVLLREAAELVFDAGPREFLALFRDAAAVVTNSFHGAAFSLQFRKNFFTSMSPKERAQPTFSRIYSLLSRLGCADRIIGLDDTAPLEAQMDYDKVYERLEAERADSLAYLKAALEGTALPEERPQPDAPARPNLCAREDCTGCTACAAVCPVNAIAMEADHEGFLRPVVGESCILCRKCEATCPMLHLPVPGPAPAQAHAVWNSDEAERLKSSSGGFFSLLARHVLEQGGAVFGAVLDETMTARHVCARTEEELAPMRGSKYVQSDLGDSFRQAKELLDNGTPVLFSGVPCQVDGFKRYLGKSYDNLLTCDLVCHGVPSPAVFRAWLDGLEAARGAKVTGVRFKDKSHGWSHPWLTVTFADGSVYTEDFNRTGYGRGFGMQLFLRPACALCKYTSTSRPADFTLADYWGLDPKLELPVERDKGVSMVLVNSARGQVVYDALAGQFGQTDRPLEEAVTGNPRLKSPLKANPKRGAFFAAFAALPFQEVEKRFLALPPLHYRAAARVLTPAMKDRLRKLLK